MTFTNKLERDRRRVIIEMNLGSEMQIEYLLFKDKMDVEGSSAKLMLTMSGGDHDSTKNHKVGQ